MLEDKAQEAILFLRATRSATFDLWINEGKASLCAPEYVDLYERGNDLHKEEKVYALKLPLSEIKQGDNRIVIQSSSVDFKVKRIELILKYGEISTSGYF